MPTLKDDDQRQLNFTFLRLLQLARFRIGCHSKSELPVSHQVRGPETEPAAGITPPEKVGEGGVPRAAVQTDAPSDGRGYAAGEAGEPSRWPRARSRGGTAGTQAPKERASLAALLRPRTSYPLSASPELGSAAGGGADVPSPAGAATIAATGFVSPSSAAIAFAAAPGPGPAPAPGPGPVPAAAITAASQTSRETTTSVSRELPLVLYSSSGKGLWRTHPRLEECAPYATPL